jgi:hypothetical protein
MTEPMDPAQRREIIREYAAVWGIKTFIETGTADGQTTWELKDDFRTLHTIEVNKALYDLAAARFADVPHVRCWWGDSGKVLPLVLHEVKGRAILWLDGHWSGVGPNPNGPDTPIREELSVLFKPSEKLIPWRHVILIDDARCFREGDAWAENEYDWPPLSTVESLAGKAGFNYELAQDIIRLTPVQRSEPRKFQYPVR